MTLPRHLRLAWQFWPALIILAAGFAPVILADNQPPLVYENWPFPVLSPVVPPGGVVVMQVRRCNRSKAHLDYTYSRSMINVESGDRIDLEGGTLGVEPGCETITSATQAVPSDVRPGHYIISGSSSVIGSRTPAVFWQTGPFEVRSP